MGLGINGLFLLGLGLIFSLTAMGGEGSYRPFRDCEAIITYKTLEAKRDFRGNLKIDGDETKTLIPFHRAHPVQSASTMNKSWL